jgi:CRISPR system Cascade subunit CasB
MRADRFVQHLETLSEENRGAMATLRRSLAFDPGTFPPAYQFVEAFVVQEEGWRWGAHYLVAGLYAMHTSHTPDPEESLGRALARLYERRPTPSTEARFINLLNADPDQLSHRLRQVVALLKGEAIPLNYARLLLDLQQWSRDDRRVQQIWARHFYRTPPRAEFEEAQESADTGEGRQSKGGVP